MDFLLGLDIGTSNIKGVLSSVDGKQFFTEKASFVYDKEDKKVEIPAERYIDTCCGVLKKLCAKLPAGGKILSMSAASASGNLVLLDKEGKPLTPIYNWQDSRVTTEAKELLEGIDFASLYEIAGWPFGGTGMPLALFCWVKKHHPEIIEKCATVCMSTEYLFYRLTGKFGIGTSAGTPFFFIDQQKGEYNKQLLDKLNLSEDMFPPVMETGSKLGEVTKEGAQISGLQEGVSVVLGTFDHPSAARAVGVLKQGQLLLSCGTSWVGFCPVEKRETGVANRLLLDPFLSPKGCYGTMFSLASASVYLEKFIRKHISDSDDVFIQMGKLAARSPLGANGLCLDPYKDYSVEELAQYSKEDIARAIMESIAKLLNQRLTALKAHGIAPTTAVMTGGPTQNPLWIDILEQITGLKVQVMHGTYAGAIGAIMLAGIECGVYKDEQSAYEALKEA